MAIITVLYIVDEISNIHHQLKERLSSNILSEGVLSITNIENIDY
ncbi:hypothetical protein [Colwellia sp. 75C3]|nr:hypothetical protein [Colwellia sp. 75C3]